uniref:Reverse transcriptase domain-containing protein n=1 Tax=Tanacetum cinerariifolium TaxID=118510 RepID=A0A6L2MXN9_TANCI|nr:reverse transcriptase domain-containing protein [Tanacetum cinerariifolium]
MSTRSSERNLFPPFDNPELTIRRRSRADPTLLNDFEMATEGTGDLPVPDLRTMEELCLPSLNGRGGPIAPFVIQAMNFGLKNDMIQQSIKVNGVTDDALRLYLFPHSLTHHATTWCYRLPRNSINTFEQMAKMFLGKYFPPFMVTKLRNEITNFCQCPDESLFEAWECYKLSINRCPNHNMLPVTQIDTFYNCLTLRHHDTINAAAGGTFMKRRPEECYDLIENMTAHYNDWDTSAQRSESSSSITSTFDTEIAALKAEMAEINKNLMRPPLATPRTYMLREPIKVIPTNLKGASHGQNPLLAYQALVYQASVHQPQIPKPQFVTTNEFTSFMKANDSILKNMQTNMTSLTNSNIELKNMFDFDADPRVPLILGRYFLKTGRALIDVFEEFLNYDPSLPTLNQGNYLPQVRKELKICEAKTDKSSIDEPPEVEPKDLPSHLEYVFLEGDDKLPVIIAKDLSIEEKIARITDDFEPVVQHQRRVNPKIHDAIKNEVLKLLDAGLIYPIFDSRWRYMMAIFHDMIEKTIEVFMYDFSVFGNSFQTCLSHLEKMLKRCEDTNLCLNWKNSHFMVKEGIVIGHKIYKNGIEVDKAKVDVIAKFPHPTTIKCIRSFLGHAGFYRRCIKDFLKIARPMTRLLKKDTLFFFSKECVEAFQTLKRKLNEAPILIALDWDLPFDLMCDASDFVINAVLEKRQEKHFRPIYYASKIMTEAESNYTTMEKEMLTVGFGTPRAIISDQGTHFCNDQFAKVMLKFGVTHRLATPYHPQTSGRVEVSNRGLKRILERIVGENLASWSNKLDDALLAFRTAYKTPIGCTLYKLVYEKACHLQIELEHKAYWALKHANFDLQTVGDHKKFQLNELNKLHDQAYKNSFIYKEKTKRLHDSKIKDCVFNIGGRVLLFNSRLKIFSSKLKCHWSGPFTISHVFPYGTVELY